MYDLILEDATIIGSQGRRVADVGVEDGRIVYVGDRPGAGAKRRVSAIGRFLIPGLVDTHVHFRDPGHPAKEDWSTGSSAAVAAGITTVCDMPNTNPPTLRRADWEEKRARAAAASVANFGIWVGASADNLDDARALADDGDACGIKAFMGASTGPLLVDDATLQRFFAGTRAVLGVHAEDETILEAEQARWRATPNPSHNDVRPGRAAAAAVRRLVALCRAHPRPVHVCHVTTAAELEILDAVRGELPITTEVTPHHLWLSTDDDLGTWGKCNPPLRTEMDRRALWTALRRGRIDTVGSDHAPHTREEKQREYWSAPSGIPGVDTMLPLLLSGVRQARLSYERLVQMACERPAEIFRFTRKGRVEVGCDADLVLFQEAELVKLAASDLLTRAGWSPFVGQRLGARPEQVYVLGRLVAERGRIVDGTPRGRLVAPTRA